MAVRLEYVGERVFRSPRGKNAVKGTLTVRDENGDVLGTYKANTGGGANDYRTRLGPLPPGVYKVSSFRNRTTAGMVFDGVGYSFNLDPSRGTEVFRRSLFRIHPDGGSEQTNGCIGIRERAARSRQCRDQIRALLDRGSVELSCDYGALDARIDGR
jgi:hypothetical protein